MNTVINSFFYGSKLNLLERLTIHSFLANNFQFNLYTYNKKCTDIKDNNFNIIDANEIVDNSKFFTYVGRGDCPKNSVGGFSDIFRFNLLTKTIGWYVDMDVTCLKSFDDLQDTIVFKPSKNFGAVANVIKCNDSGFNKSVLNDYNAQININNDSWCLPLEIFYNNINKYNYLNKIVDKNVFGDDSHSDLLEILEKNVYELSSLPSHAIHWCNTACTTSIWNKRLKIDWDNPSPVSLYYTLLKKYNLVK